MQGGVCKTRTEMKYSCRAGFTNQIWKFYDNAMISTASLIRKRCCQDVYEFVVPFGFTKFVVPSFTMFKHSRCCDHVTTLFIQRANAMHACSMLFACMQFSAQYCNAAHTTNSNYAVRYTLVSSLIAVSR